MDNRLMLAIESVEHHASTIKKVFDDNEVSKDWSYDVDTVDDELKLLASAALMLYEACFDSRIRIAPMVGVSVKCRECSTRFVRNASSDIYGRCDKCAGRG